MRRGRKVPQLSLTPATVCLAIPLYEQLNLKHNWRCWASCPACFQPA
ncbi:MAG: LrgB family protein [Ruminococcus callidus]